LAEPAVGPRFFALVPCAGSGQRAGAAGPKQYQAVAGQALVLHTLAALRQVPQLAAIGVVVAPDDGFDFPVDARLFVANCGGSTRTISVLNGLTALTDRGADANDWVLVHDAARCLVLANSVTQLIAQCEHDAVGGLLACPLPDTLKVGQDGRVTQTLARSDKWLAQTPQMFRIGPLQSALAAALARGLALTDEASAMEAAGLAPKLVACSAMNFKVTYPDDFALAQAVLLGRQVLTATPPTPFTPTP
jgi:2-C-methyl-D-erythritol 4-phosphate cytidylyltransferase